MALRLHCGPHRSGRTTALLTLANRVVSQGGLVWWIGLPTQRASIYHRITQLSEAAIGFEFLSFQQFTYRVLTAEQGVEPLLVGSARLVAVAEALIRQGGVPSPGEARLFNDAIAEAKRYGVSPQGIQQLAKDDREAERLARVYATYEEIIRGTWDYDDARDELLNKLETTKLESLEPTVVIVDGFRDFAPSELRILELLAEYVDVHVAVREVPLETEADVEMYETIAPTTVEELIAPNPVGELRYVLSRVKEDLIAGMNLLDMAIITPDNREHTVRVLAEEFGIPVFDEQPASLAETTAGQVLVHLLTLPESPTATNVLAILPLAGLAGELLQHNIAGADAIAEIAEQSGMREEWDRWFELLDDPTASFEWANHIVREVLPQLTDDLTPTWQNKALSAAQEAAKLGYGVAFREWWVALLEHTFERVDIPIGVPVLTTTRIANRQFRKAYVTGASQGAYSTGEREDYFIAEDHRQKPGESLNHALPVRYAGTDEVLFDELRTRADHLVISAPAADQSGGHPHEPALLHNPVPVPEYALGSTLIPATVPYLASFDPVALSAVPTAEFLRQYDQCPFRAWTTRQLGIRDEEDVGRPWYAWRDALLEEERLTERRIEELSEQYPQFGEWLAKNQEVLTDYTFRPRISSRTANAYPDAARRFAENGARVGEIVRFVSPYAAVHQLDANTLMQGRWNELWAAMLTLHHPRANLDNVFITIWPLLGEPLRVYPGGVAKQEYKLKSVQRDLRRVAEDYRSGEVPPRPGFHCRTCPVFDTCREGVL